MPRKFDAPINEYPAEFLECRGWGHQWRFSGQLVVNRDQRGYAFQFLRQSECVNCTKKKIVVIGRDMRAAKSGARYIDPEGYATTGTSRLDVVRSREEYVRRLIDF